MTTGLSFLFDQSCRFKFQMKLNLENSTLRVALNASPPFVFLKWHQGLKMWQGDGGFELRMIETLSEYFHFNYQLINCHHVWGAKAANGSWSGLIGQLQANEADLGIGGVTLTYDRSQAVSFLYPHVISSVTFITPAPQPAPNLYLVFQPFSPDVWAGFLLSLLTCALFDLLYNHLYRPQSGGYTKIFWISMYSMFRQQCSHSVRETSSMNTWILFWSLATFVLTTGYAGSLYSLLAIPVKAKTLDTVAELAEATKGGKVILNGVANSAYTDTLINSRLPQYTELGKVLVPVASKREGFETVVKNTKKPHAFISTRESLRYAMVRYGEDQMYLTPEGQSSALFIDLLMVPMAKQFKYKAAFDLAIAQLIATGLLDHWKESEYLKLRLSLLKTENRGEPDDPSQDFTLSQLQSFFTIYLFMGGLSILAFVGEFLYFTLTI